MDGSTRAVFLGFVLCAGIALVSCQSYEDKRCKCVCPSVAVLTNTSSSHSDRKLYIANVPPNKCNCDGVILPQVGDEIKGREQEYCPRCECKYESRNTTIIKVVVIIVIFVTMMLLVYMGFLLLLDPLINKPVKASYQKHNDDVLQVVVIIVIFVTMMLMVYMGFLLLLDPLINKRVKASYQEHTNEEDDGSVSPGGSSHQMGARGNVLNRVTHQQDKWQRQVREQRRNIYDRHTMLN